MGSLTLTLSHLLSFFQGREWYQEDATGQSIKASGIPREQLFITTKIHPRHLGWVADNYGGLGYSEFRVWDFWGAATHHY